MQKKNVSRYLSVWVVFVLTAWCSGVAFAQTIPSGTFVVRPAKAELDIAPGETKTVMLRVSNGTPVPLHVETSFEDVAPKSQSSATENPIQLLGGTDGAYSLKNSLSVSRSSFDLLSLKEVIVPVQITIPKYAIPGGKYGSVIFQFSPALSEGADLANVSVESRVAVLLYVRITGDVKEEGKLVAFGVFNEETFVAPPTQLSPLQFQVSFENTGDVYLNPHGTILVSGLFGRKEVIEIDSFAVLPKQIRMRELNLHTPLTLGYYTATLSLARGYGDGIDTKEVKFFVLPSGGVLLALFLGAIILFFLIRKSLRLSRGSIS